MRATSKIAVRQNKISEPENFYARFIGIGLVGYMHDMTWAYIFKNQIYMLMELNRKMISMADAKTFYDKVVLENQTFYTNYSLEHWIGYMLNEQLLIKHPSDMLEITHRGRDFLKYIAHWGHDINVKRG